MRKSTLSGHSVIYQSKNGSLELKADAKYETIWLTQQQVAELFGVKKAAVSKHVKNIFESEELHHKATVSKMETVQKEGARSVKRDVEYYNLDQLKIRRGASEISNACYRNPRRYRRNYRMI